MVKFKTRHDETRGSISITNGCQNKHHKCWNGSNLEVQDRLDGYFKEQYVWNRPFILYGSMRFCFLSKLEVCASKVIRQRSKIFWGSFLMFFCAIVTQRVSGIASCVGFVGARRPELTVLCGAPRIFARERVLRVRRMSMKHGRGGD